MGGGRLFPASEAEEINWDECLEVRFFSNSAEIHFFRRDSDWEAVLIEDDAEQDCIDRWYQLSRKYKHSSKTGKILVREYLAYDEDGQACVVCTRLAGLKQEEYHG